MEKLILYTSLSLVCFSNKKSEVSAQKLSSQRRQQLFPILHKKGSFYSRTAIRSKQTDYANFQKKKKECTLYEYLKNKKFRVHCSVSCIMLKVVNLHQKPRKNRSQRKLELKYQGKCPQNKTKNHSTNPMPFFLARRLKNCTGMALCDIVIFQTVKQLEFTTQ